MQYERRSDADRARICHRSGTGQTQFGSELRLDWGANEGQNRGGWRCLVRGRASFLRSFSPRSDLFVSCPLRPVPRMSSAIALFRMGARGLTVLGYAV